MIVRRIAIKGFMSYREKQVFTFDAAPLWVLAGANGSGKSTVFDAITFVLYGCHRGGLRPSKDLINHDSDTLMAELDFELDHTVYRLRRTLSRRGGSTRSISVLDGENLLPVPDTDSQAEFDRWVAEHVRLSYRSFISSVLLLQGQSERLLNAEPRERYELLSELIDLEVYQRLHALAEERRKGLAEQLKVYTTQLQSIQIQPEELSEASNRLAARKSELEAAKAYKERLTTLHLSARDWEHWSNELARLDKQLEEYELLTRRAEEITAGYEQFTKLSAIVPVLRAIEQKRSELKRVQLELEEGIGWQSELKQRQLRLKERRQNIQRRLHELHLEIETLEELRQSRSIELEQATRLFEQFKERNRLRERANTLEAELLELRASAERHSELEQLLKQARSAAVSLKWLRRLLELREERFKLEIELEAALKRSRELKEALTSAHNLIERLSKELSEAATARLQAAERLSAAKERKEQILSQSTLLAKSTGVCYACGQTVTPEHIELEMAKYRQTLDAEEAKLTACLHFENESIQRQAALESELESAKMSLSLLQKDTTEREVTLLTARLEYLRAELSRYEAEALLPLADIDSELEQSLEREAACVQSLESELVHLAYSPDRLVRTEIALEECRSSLQPFTSLESIPLPDLDILQNEYQRLITLLEEKRGEHSRLEGEVAEVMQIYAELEGDLQAVAVELARKQERELVVREGLEAEVNGLGQEWRREVSREELEYLEQKLKELEGYEQLQKELGLAEAAQVSLQKELGRVKEVLASIPEEARQPAALLAAKIEDAKRVVTECESALQDAQALYTGLEKDLKNWQALEQERLQADYKLKLHKIICDALGREGLQLQLLRDAERAIVAYADEILDGLSRGRLRLELRQDEEDGRRALDLLVKDMQTGAQPMPVALVSGSQRFRIAVSLALAIGRYVRGRTGGAQTVIIDEGFGSLDKNGRDDIIEQLQQLQQRLARIILVSHQEEFTSAFNNGYSVTIQDGASRVRLWSRD